MNIHNLSREDILALLQELEQLKLSNITEKELSIELVEILNVVKQITVHS